MRDLVDRLAAHLGDRYALESELGRGATAIVYRARDLRLNRLVAIKVFDPELVGGFGVERFVREITLEAQLNHPHIVPLLDTGEVEGIPYFVMPCIEGETLRARLDRERELPVDDAVQIAHDVAVALMYAHERGIIHRDIKPENILLTAGTAVVADFGIARALTELGANQRLTQTGVAVGTLPYMSPEQAMAESSIDGRADIYSLGCTLFEMLVGEAPHTGPTAQIIIAKRLSEPPRSARLLRTSVSTALDRVVMESLAVSRADRYPTAKAFIDALGRARSGERQSGAVVPVDPAAASAATKPSYPRWIVVAALALAIAAAVGAGLFWRVRANAPAAPGTSSIAVLPFADLSEGRDQEYFSLGMAEELIRAFSQLPGLRVTGRTSSFALRGTTDDVQTIGRRLGVSSLLTGSIRRAGDSLRISAELVNTADGSTRWSNAYDRPARDVFAVQEEIAHAIALELSLDLGPRGTLIAPTTKDLGAYHLYLRGRLAWTQRTAESLTQAVDYYRQAVTLDPKFARAWASMADTYTAIARNLFGKPSEYLPLARDATLRAMTLDSASAEARAARGAIAHYLEHDWALAQAEYERAIALDPMYADAYYFHALFLTTVQHGDSALAQARRAVALEPLSVTAQMGPGMVLYLTHRSREAAQELRGAIAANPRFYFTHIWYALALATSGDSTAAIAEADEAVRLAPGNRLMVVMRGQALAHAGRTAEASAIARQARADARRIPIASFELARLYAILGDRAAALEWIGRSIDEKQTQSTQLLTPGFEALRDDPQFGSYLRAMRLDPAPR